MFGDVTSVRKNRVVLYIYALNVLLERAGALVQWLKLSVWKFGNCGLESRSGFQVRRCSNYVSGGSVISLISHQEVLLAQFSLYVQKGGLKLHSFLFGDGRFSVWPKVKPNFF